MAGVTTRWSTCCARGGRPGLSTAGGGATSRATTATRCGTGPTRWRVRSATPAWGRARWSASCCRAGPTLVAALFAVWRAGGVHVPLNPRLTATELGRGAADVDPAVVVTTARRRGPVRRPHARGPLAGPGSLTRPEEPPAPAAADPAPWPCCRSRRAPPDAPCRRPPQSHDRVLARAGIDQVIGTLRAVVAGGGPPMPNLVPVPLSLWAGIYQVLFAFRAGAPVVLMDGFDTRRFADLVRRFAIRSTGAAAGRDGHAGRRRARRRPGAAALRPQHLLAAVAAAGPPLPRPVRHPGAQRLRPDRAGRRGVGLERGRLEGVRRRQAGLGGPPHAGVEVTTSTAIPHPASWSWCAIPGRPHPDGWLRTGDVARIDDDGFVWIEGRVSDMINRGGLKVHPAEVEEVLRLSPAGGRRRRGRRPRRPPGRGARGPGACPRRARGRTCRLSRPWSAASTWRPTRCRCASARSRRAPPQRGRQGVLRKDLVAR